jgi:hypothetical protein
MLTLVWIVCVYVAPPGCYPVGDVNCDGRVDFGDVNAFVQAVGDPDGYAAAVGPECDRRRNGDLNCDGAVDFGDIDPFVEAVTDPDWRPGNRPRIALAQTVLVNEDEPTQIELTSYDPDGGVNCP